MSVRSLSDNVICLTSWIVPRMSDFIIEPGAASAALDTAFSRLEQLRFAEGLWARRLDMWTTDEVVQQTIANRLGWLDAIGLITTNLSRLETFAQTSRAGGLTDVVLFGMGGSSLAPEVLPSGAWTRRRVAAVPHARFDRPGRGARRAHQRGDLAVHHRQQVGHDDRAELHGGRGAASSGGRGRQGLGVAVRRHHGREHGLFIGARSTTASSRSSSTRRTSAGATPPCRSSGWCRRR